MGSNESGHGVVVVRVSARTRACPVWERPLNWSGVCRWGASCTRGRTRRIHSSVQNLVVRPKSRLGIRTELKGVCFSLFGLNVAVCVFLFSARNFSKFQRLPEAKRA